MNQPVTSAVSAPHSTATSPAAPAPSGNTSGTGSGTILLPHPSPSLSAQAEGQLIRAVVVGPTADNQYIIDTRYGRFAVALPNAPTPGSVLQLQIVKAGTPVELILIGTDTRVPATSTTAPVFQLPNPPPALLTLTQGEIFRALVIGPAGNGNTLIDTRFGQLTLPLPGQPTAGTALQLQVAAPGIPLELRLLASDTSATGQNPAARPSAATALAPGETVVGRFSATANSSTASPAALAAGAFHAKVVAIHPASPASSLAHDDAIVTGRIVASQQYGPTVIETAAGRIVLPTTSGGVVDRFVTLQIIAEPGTVLPSGPGAEQLRSLMSLSQSWPALERVMEAVQASNPQLAAQFAATSVPNTGITLTAGIALFLALLTRGQVSEWLGADMVRLLESGNRQALLGQLGDDFNQMTRLAGEPANGDWRTAMLPLMHDGQLHQIRLYLRRRDGGDEGGDAAQGTRFVVEASLSRLGDIQLDGLVRGSRFDLMVRTQTPFAQHMRDEITALFETANEEFGVQGRINFQVQSKFPVDPVDEATDHAVGVFA